MRLISEVFKGKVSMTFRIKEAEFTAGRLGLIQRLNFDMNGG
jgi:hypothetical protein